MSDIASLTDTALLAEYELRLADAALGVRNAPEARLIALRDEILARMRRREP